MMKLTVASALAATASASGTLGLSFTDCGDASTHGKVSDIEPKSLTLGDTTDITGTGTVDTQVTGGSFQMDLTAAGIVHETFNGDVCSAKSFDINVLGVKVGSLTWKGLACPVAAGPASVPLSAQLASALPAALATTKIALTATATDSSKLICVDLTLKKEATLAAPERPHLAQAWTALSMGDGSGNQTGKESYYWSADGKFKAHQYVYDGCTKLSLHDPSSPYLKHVKGGERNYYLGCDAVNCCYKDFQMKQWDITNPGPLTKVNFVGIEDTTELNGNPVSQAEHWHQNTTIFIKTSAAYDYYITRTQTNTSEDIISHRIDFGAQTSQGPVAGGSILYANFQPQHDIETFKQVFAVPEVCQRPNLLKCPGDKLESWEKNYFKHDYFLRQLQAEVVV